MAHHSSSTSDYSQDNITDKAAPISPTTEHHHHSNLEEYDDPTAGRPPFILTYTEVKLLGIAGMSIALSYDHFFPHILVV